VRYTGRVSALVALGLVWLCTSPGGSPAEGCSSFVLVDDGFAVFATNYDNEIHEGMLYINKRGLHKSGWTSSTTGEIAQWKSRFASVTVNQATYQFPWAGMNEAGLCLSTMALNGTVTPPPDARCPLEYGPLWMQYILDTCASIEDVVAADETVRLVQTVDHYLVTDRGGNSAVIEFLDGEMVVHTGEDLRVTALTNSTYAHSLETWLLYRGTSNTDCRGTGDSLERFCTVAGRVDAFSSAMSEDTVAYAFDTLGTVESLTPWSFVFDTRDLRAYFRTQPHDEVRFIDLRDAELRCKTPAKMLDVHEQLTGDVTGAFTDFDFEIVLERFLDYIYLYQQDPVPPEQVLELLRLVDGYPCVDTHYRRPAGRLRPAR